MLRNLSAEPWRERSGPRIKGRTRDGEEVRGRVPTHSRFIPESRRLCRTDPWGLSANSGHKHTAQISLPLMVDLRGHQHSYQTIFGTKFRLCLASVCFNQGRSVRRRCVLSFDFDLAAGFSPAAPSPAGSVFASLLSAGTSAPTV